LGRLRKVVRPAHGGGQGLSPDGDGSQAMIVAHRRFTPVQRLLHWLMAACILAVLFIGVGMVSTVMPKYLTLVAIHKPLGIAILHTLLWDAHFYLAFAFFALVLLHAAAALFHALVRRDGVFETMASAGATYEEVAPAKQGRHAV